MVIVLMGVSGSGKTTVGKVLASELGWTFIEADDFHSPENVEKMRSGTPLTDDDRRPWLEALRERIDDCCRRGENVILACSALKDEYRDLLEENNPACVEYVYLAGSEELIRERLQQRKGHFMNPALLKSQFQTLEVPDEEAVQVDVDQTPEAIAGEIREKFKI